MNNNRIYRKTGKWNTRLTQALNRNAHFVFVKLDTTGLDPDTDEIIGIHLVAARMEHGELKMVNAFESNAKNTVPLTAEIKEITGLTDEILSDAPDLRTTMELVASWMKNLEAEYIVLTGFNMQFLGGFIKKASSETNVKLPFNATIDISTMAAAMLKEGHKGETYGVYSYGQKSLFDYFDVNTKHLGNAYVTVFQSLIDMTTNGTTQFDSKFIRNGGMYEMTEDGALFHTRNGDLLIDRDGFFEEITPGFFHEVNMDAIDDGIKKRYHLSELIDIFHTEVES